MYFISNVRTRWLHLKKEAACICHGLELALLAQVYGLPCLYWIVESGELKPPKEKNRNTNDSNPIALAVACSAQSRIIIIMVYN